MFHSRRALEQVRRGAPSTTLLQNDVHVLRTKARSGWKKDTTVLAVFSSSDRLWLWAHDLITLLPTAGYSEPLLYGWSESNVGMRIYAGGRAAGEDMDMCSAENRPRRDTHKNPKRLRCVVVRRGWATSGHSRACASVDWMWALRKQRPPYIKRQEGEQNRSTSSLSLSPLFHLCTMLWKCKTSCSLHVFSPSINRV